MNPRAKAIAERREKKIRRRLDAVMLKRMGIKSGSEQTIKRLRRNPL